MRAFELGLVVIGCLALRATVAAADTVTLEHADWQMFHAGIVEVTATTQDHGSPLMYSHAPAIPDPGLDWTALTGSEARNPVDIDYLGPNDDYSSGLRSCLTEVDFTYFQTTVNVPQGIRMSTALITMGPCDDGARVLVFNSAYPNGIVPPDGYVTLGDVKTIDLAKYIKAGEENRFIVEHIDDCSAQGWLGRVEMNLTGTLTAGRETWGTLKIKYR